MTTSLIVSRVLDTICECKDPWSGHPDGFMWEPPADGRQHRARETVRESTLWIERQLHR